MRLSVVWLLIVASATALLLASCAGPEPAVTPRPNATSTAEPTPVTATDPLIESLLESIERGEAVRKQLASTLSEETRRRIFWELVEAQDRADRDATRRFPPSLHFNEWAELVGLLEDEYTEELAKAHGLNREQTDEIAVEGLLKGWPLPPIGGP